MKGFMKKVLGMMVFLFATIAFSNIAIAPTPCPFNGRIVAIPPESVIGQTLELYQGQNLLATYIINEDKEYAIDIGHLIDCDDGGIFNLVIRECSENPVCSKEVVLTGPGIIAHFDLSGVILPTTTTTTITTTTTTIPADYCESQDYIKEEDCPKVGISQEELITYILSSLGVGGLLTGGGIKIVLRKRKEGKEEIQITQHKHKVSPRGRAFYHSIYTRHKNENYRHKPGQIEIPKEWL